MNTYVLIDDAPDGRHVSVYKTEADALAAMAGMLRFSADEWGRPLKTGKTYWSDWRHRLVVEERKDRTAE